MEFGRKRGRQDGVWNGASKRSREESENFTSGVGSKSKPCTKFFSTYGCPFGEGCHFLHHVPGGYSAVSQVTNFGGHHARNAPTPSFSDGPTSNAKTKLCNNINTPEGCKFGDKCRFAHSEMEIGKPSFSGYEDPRGPGPMNYGYHGGPGRVEPSPPGMAAAANFGVSATAKISIDGSLAGPIIGKGGVNSKQICRMTGVKLAIREHDSDKNQKNIELEGTFDQIKEASAMVRELIMNISASAAPGGGGPPPQRRNANGSGGMGRDGGSGMGGRGGMGRGRGGGGMGQGRGGGMGRGGGGGGHQGPPGTNFKTKMCENFAKGVCTFGEKCHFAHGPNELRMSVA